MFRRSTDVLLISGIALAAAIAVFVPGIPASLRAALALPLVLLAPGYALIAAVTPAGAQGIVERLLFGVGLSLMIAALGGVALHWMPWGIQASSWTVLLLSVTLGGCVIALVRRIGACPDSGPPHLRPSVVQVALFGLAGLIAAGAVGVAAVGAEQVRTPGFTQLWAIPAGTPDMVQLGVENHESTSMAYMLRVESQGQTLETGWPILLKPGERWEMATHINTDMLRQPGVTVMLYRQDAPEHVYRQVVLSRNAE